jgi:hypothetical protein
MGIPISLYILNIYLNGNILSHPDLLLLLIGLLIALIIQNAGYYL